MDPVSETPAAIDFRRFRVLPHRRELLAEGRRVELGGRAFDVLMALIEASGAVVDKNTLMNRVWPDRIVEDNSLQAQISALRKAFAADRDLIRTIAGRGYQFTGEIRSISANPDAQATAGMAQPTSTPSRPPTNLPEPVSELIGRDVELDEILDLSSGFTLFRHLLCRRKVARMARTRCDTARFGCSSSGYARPRHTFRLTPVLGPRSPGFVGASTVSRLRSNSLRRAPLRLG